MGCGSSSNQKQKLEQIRQPIKNIRKVKIQLESGKEFYLQVSEDNSIISIKLQLELIIGTSWENFLLFQKENDKEIELQDGTLIRTLKNKSDFFLKIHNTPKGQNSENTDKKFYQLQIKNNKNSKSINLNQQAKIIGSPIEKHKIPIKKNSNKQMNLNKRDSEINLGNVQYNFIQAQKISSDSSCQNQIINNKSDDQTNPNTQDQEQFPLSDQNKDSACFLSPMRDKSQVQSQNQFQNKNKSQKKEKQKQKNINITNEMGEEDYHEDELNISQQMLKIQSHNSLSHLENSHSFKSANSNEINYRTNTQNNTQEKNNSSQKALENKQTSQQKNQQEFSEFSSPEIQYKKKNQQKNGPELVKLSTTNIVQKIQISQSLDPNQKEINITRNNSYITQNDLNNNNIQSLYQSYSQSNIQGIFINFYQGKLIFIEIQNINELTLQELKNYIEQSEQIPEEDQKYIFKGEGLPLDQNLTLQDMGIQYGDTLYIDQTYIQQQKYNNKIAIQQFEVTDLYKENIPMVQ
ncbi:hypothetical protein PPERSA_04089 [Pseudocohnilembus persalinus]|uniref:Ubiquitin-like domain-containing protein n=1 Tax=Pseudocohnilembus persalinus TaxID=266149 RepID=A0A0V0QKY9_PSEPJ|nr:hypothetical protein PPERSA_04089 [Pseudocohnilembus persalinus]|eukprot:KRX02886.1 hypothetical protein PPERSA_04089 [Pseudocohnilembus persalinus]